MNKTNKELWYYLKGGNENKIIDQYILDKWEVSLPREGIIFNEENYQCQEDKLYISYEGAKIYELLKGEDIKIK